MYNHKLIILCGLVCMFFAACHSNSAPAEGMPAAAGEKKDIAAIKDKTLPVPVFHNLEDYVKWVKSPASGLISIQEKSGYSFELSYRPALLEVLSGLSGGEKLTDARLAKLKEPYHGLQYYHFRVYANGSSLEDLRFKDQGAESVSEYCAYRGEQHFNLVMGVDTLSPSLYHFENTYPHVPYLSFVLAFQEPEAKETEYRTLLVNDLLLPDGVLKVSLSNASVLNQPNPININQIWH